MRVGGDLRGELQGLQGLPVVGGDERRPLQQQKLSSRAAYLVVGAAKEEGVKAHLRRQQPRLGGGVA